VLEEYAAAGRVSSETRQNNHADGDNLMTYAGDVEHEFYAGEEVNPGDPVTVNHGGVLFRLTAQEKYPVIGVALNRAITTERCHVATHGVVKCPLQAGYQC
jgi:hypothetical protein